MYPIIKRLLFLLAAEKAHRFTLSMLQILLSFPPFARIFRAAFSTNDPSLRRTVFGIRFKNPVGLAAGFDKNGAHTREFSAMGFGFVEIGTVTPLPQPGNPTPRLFRLPKDQALINRMGFNNDGMNQVRENLANRPEGLVIGGNIGKNKVTPNEAAVSDYLKCFETLFPVVDYFVVNVSSPNTPDLRKLQEKEPLRKLLRRVLEANRLHDNPKPILLKIAPDLTDPQLDDILEITADLGLAGIIATNTTISRDGLMTDRQTVEAMGNGGLSGGPLTKRATDVIRYIRQRNPEIPIVAAGGILSPEDALEKLTAGANLVQIYTGLVYKGPALVSQINKAILENS